MALDKTVQVELPEHGRISEDFIDLSQVSALVFHDRMMWSGKPEDSIIVPIN